MPSRRMPQSSLDTWYVCQTVLNLPHVNPLQQCAAKDSAGWCGISLGGGMTNSLLITAWPHEDTVYTSLRYATGYAMPDVYSGNAEITQVSSKINETHFTLIFRCKDCLKWDHNGQVGGPSTTGGALVLGWVQAFPSPGNPTCPAEITLEQHDNGMGIWGAVLDAGAANPVRVSPERLKQGMISLTLPNSLTPHGQPRPPRR